MPPKSRRPGRPVATDTSDPSVLLRREQSRKRTQRCRERQQAAAVNNPPSVAQLNQSESVVAQFTTLVEPPPTPTQLGLRVQNLHLGQDPSSVLEQLGTADVDEDTVQDNCQTQHLNIHTPKRSIASIFTAASEDRVSSRLSDHHSLTNPNDERSMANQTFERQRTPLDPPSFYPPAGTQDQVDAPHPEENSSPQLFVDFDFGTTASSCSSPTPVNRASEQTSIDGNQQEFTHEAQDASAQGHEEAHSLPPQLQDEIQSPLTQDASSPAPLSPATASFVDELSPAEQVAHQLVDQLQTHGFHGCSDAQHSIDLAKHHEAVGPDDHCDLRRLLSTDQFPSVFSPTRIHRVLTPNDVTNIPNPPAAAWRSVFSGVTPGTNDTRHACLHQEETQPQQPSVSYDIDSFLGFASSLAFARQGIWYQPIPLARQNVQTNVHVDTHTHRLDEDDPEIIHTVPTAIKDVPHFHLGRVEGSHDISIHVLFPNLDPPEHATNIVSHENQKKWLDEIFLPAIYRFSPSHRTQHFPGGFQQATLASRARQVEDRLVRSHNYQSQQAISYFLTPEVLIDVWDAVVTKTEEAGYHHFSEPQIYFSAKGTKLQYKSTPERPTLLATLQNFRSSLNTLFDFDFIYTERLYVDVGKEVCPPASFLSSQSPTDGQEPQVYLWKECCLKSYLKWLYNGQVPKSGTTWYHVGFLRDACNLSCEPSKTSTLRKGGLVYSQFYGSFKETIDACKTYPFQNDGLEELCLDNTIRKGAQAIGGGRARDIDVIRNAYLASKRRLHTSLESSRAKSFGLREEHRMSWVLFQALIERLTALLDQDVPLLAREAPSYAWAIRTSRFFEFLAGNVAKFATGFELVTARANANFYSWEDTKMMAVFLRCLRFFVVGGHLPRESALWWSRRDYAARPESAQSRPRTWYGLGFANTLSKYGYCWLEPRFDWRAPAFKSSVTDNVLFGNKVLRDQYLRRGGQVQDFLSTTRRLDVALELLRAFHRRHQVVEHRLLDTVIHVILQQFRVDTIRTLAKRDVHVTQHAHALKGQQPFTFDYLDGILLDGAYLVSGNRSKAPDPSTIVSRLFHNTYWPRPHWEDKPFRTMYARARAYLISHFHTRDVYSQFKRDFMLTALRFHWVLPYPARDGFSNRTKEGQFIWYSITLHRTTGAEHDLRPVDYVWARGKHREGHAPSLPPYLNWTHDQWQTQLGP